ncbi:MAG: methyl-accepting chemotaxis protein [Desulfobacter sp.]
MTAKKKTFLLSILVLILISLISITQFSALQRVASVWESHLEEAVVRQRLLSTIESQFGYGGFIHNFKNHVLRGQAKFVDRFEKNRSTMMKAIAELNALAKSNEEREAIENIKMVAEKYARAIVVSQEMHSQGKSPREIDGVVKIDDSPAFTAFKTIEEIANKIETEGEVHMQSELNRLKIYASLGFVVLFLVAGAYFLLLHSLIRKMLSLKAFAQKVGAGDLSVTSNIDSNDEVGAIARDLDNMAGDLNQLFSNISNSAGNLASASEELATSASDMNANTEDVSMKSQSVASAAEELSSNMNSVAAAVEQAASNVSIVADSAGGMLSMINGISQNTEKAHGISDTAVAEAKDVSVKVNELKSAADEIRKVTETISDISEQTNLLALNATIEAARAGEAGKGFGVVANEIKELANQTGAATVDINSSVKNISETMVETVTRIQRITDVIDEVNGIVVTIDKAVEEQSIATNEISGNVKEAATGLEEVAERVAQSSEVSGEVAADIAGVSSAADHMSETGGTLSRRSGQLNDLAAELNRMVQKFSL